MKLYKFISYIFHPVLTPIVCTLLYFIIIPNHIPRKFAYWVLIIVFVTTYIFPLLLLYFLKKVKLIENYQLSSINERKFPIFFFTSVTLFLGIRLLKFDIIDLLAFSFFGCALALSISFILLFIKIKTSLHTLGISGLIGFISIISYEYKINLLILLILLFLIFGFIATSRLKLKAHTMSEIFIGLIIGFTSQLIIYFSNVL